MVRYLFVCLDVFCVFKVDDMDNTNISSIKVVVMRLFTKMILAMEMNDGDTPELDTVPQLIV